MTPEDITNRFTYHAPTEEDVVTYTTIRDRAKDYAIFLNKTLPESREKSLAITNLEEVVFWANAAVARNG